MIAVPAGGRVLVATKPVDFRRGADTLAALACAELQRDPFSGVIIRLPLEARGPAEHIAALYAIEKTIRGACALAETRASCCSPRSGARCSR
jgi:hypothetical protein